MAILLGVTEDEIRQARQAGLAFAATSLDAPLSDAEDSVPLADSQMHVSRLLTRALTYLRHQLTSELGHATATPDELRAHPGPT